MSDETILGRPRVRKSSGSIIHGDDDGSRETILEEAQRLVAGARNGDYGHPYEDFERIAALWRAYFLAGGQGVVKIDPEDVAMLMILLKIAREIHKPKRDSRVDMAGYAQCLDLVVEERGRRRPLPISGGFNEG